MSQESEQKIRIKTMSLFSTKDELISHSSKKRKLSKYLHQKRRQSTNIKDHLFDSFEES